MKKINKRTPFNKHVATGKKAQKLISVPLRLFRSLEYIVFIDPALRKSMTKGMLI